ncbi:MAG: hypothetical protein ACRCUT_14770 [Spirochaetota bacterium]
MREIAVRNFPESIRYSLNVKAVQIFIRKDGNVESLNPVEYEVYVDGAESPVLSDGTAGNEDRYIPIPVRLKSRNTGAVIAVVPDKIVVKVRGN